MKPRSSATTEHANGKPLTRRSGITKVPTLEPDSTGTRSLRIASPKANSVKKAMVIKTAPISDLPPVQEKTTTIEAKIDVGFGNTLFIRGTGAGLNWDQGIPLRCVDATTWVWSSQEPEDRIAFRLLINDDTGAASAIFFATPGETTQVIPVFA